MPNTPIRFKPEEIATRLKDAFDPNKQNSDVSDASEHKLKCAAVLVPLVWQVNEWHLLYTRRTDRVDSHKGQVSFPGGACDEGETSAEQTALREANEEIGIDPQDVRVLGKLPDMITVSYYLVTPVVGIIKWPTVFRVGEDEVARVFTIPLGWLANGSNRWQFERPEVKRSVIAYHPFDGEMLWGATARMTLDLLNVLGY